MNRSAPARILPPEVTVVEVAPRDGLEHTREILDPALRIRFIDALADAGLRAIEVGAFLDPAAAPQMAATAEVLRGVPRREGVRYSVLAPTEKALEAALAGGAQEVAVFLSASETFNRKFFDAAINDSLARFAFVVAAAKKAGLRVRGYVSTAFGCPYEGAVEPDAVCRLTANLLGMGVDEISVGDTIGVATPRDIDAVVTALLDRFNVDVIALHLHDTRGAALANAYRALQLGVHIFDTAAGGLGGCPLAPGASGNLATEDLVHLLHGLGIRTGIDLVKVGAASRLIEKTLGRALPSRVLRTLAPPPGGSGEAA
jgi:hydroxymethylglutaryl-CoA lyase